MKKELLLALGALSLVGAYLLYKKSDASGTATAASLPSTSAPSQSTVLAPTVMQLRPTMFPGLTMAKSSFATFGNYTRVRR